MGEDPVGQLPWRLVAPPLHHPANQAKPQRHQHHAHGTPQRPASRRHQCTGYGPDDPAVQQPGQLALSQWLRVGAGHGTSSSQRDSGTYGLAGRRVGARPPSKPRSTACAELARRHVAVGEVAASKGTTKRRRPEERDPLRGRCSVSSRPPTQVVVLASVGSLAAPLRQALPAPHCQVPIPSRWNVPPSCGRIW
jgi:hypothetical protein